MLMLNKKVDLTVIYLVCTALSYDRGNMIYFAQYID